MKSLIIYPLRINFFIGDVVTDESKKYTEQKEDKDRQTGMRT